MTDNTKTETEFYCMPDNQTVKNDTLARIAYAYMETMQVLNLRVTPDGATEISEYNRVCADAIRAAGKRLAEYRMGDFRLSDLPEPALCAEIAAAVCKGYDAGFRKGIEVGVGVARQDAREMPIGQDTVH